jgi:hypothetical protein
MDFEFQSGPKILSDGVRTLGRTDRQGALVVVGGNPWYGEPVARGSVFTGMTASTGVAPGTVLGTSGAFALYNPTGSGVDLYLIATTCSYLSGTIGAGNLYYVSHATSTTTPGGTTITPVSNALGSSAQSRAIARTTGTSLGSATGLRAFANLGAMTVNPATQPWYIKDQLDGEIVVRPSGAFSIQAVAAAGVSPLMLFSVTWAEVARLDV